MRDAPFDTEELEIDGITVKVEYHYDGDHEPPWESEDGHGPVRKSLKPHNEYHSDKKPWERPLNQAGRNEYQFYYDQREACKMARRDGWNAEPYDAPNQVARAVESDFQFLRKFLNDDWHYVGVVVKIEDEEGEELAEDSCGGYESLNDYHKTSAKEMAEALVAGYKKELAEKQHWAERDVVTT